MWEHLTRTTIREISGSISLKRERVYFSETLVSNGDRNQENNANDRIMK